MKEAKPIARFTVVREAGEVVKRDYSAFWAAAKAELEAGCTACGRTWRLHFAGGGAYKPCKETHAQT